MNDSREYIHYINTFEKLTEEQFSTDKDAESAFIDFVLEISSSMKSANIYVSSFTERGDLLSQWRGYCPNGGYSIGFRLTDLSEACAAQNLTICKAIYTDPDKSEITKTLEGIYRDFRAAWSSKDEEVLRSLIIELQRHIADQAPRYKHPGFAEEAEWRVFSPIIDWKAPEIDVVDIRGSLRPILKFGLGINTENPANDSPNLPIEEIFVSPGPDQTLRREAAVVLLHRFGVNHLRVATSKIPYTSR